MGKRAWRYQKSMSKESRKQVWKVKNKQGRTAYLKFQKQNFNRDQQMIANEFIAISLAKSLGLPVVKLSWAAIKGPRNKTVKGYISKQVVADEVISWKKVSSKVKKNPEQYVNQANELAQIIVFDVWVLNKDRTDVNLILYRNHSREKYSWYLIDFGSGLMGSPGNSPFSRVKRMKHPQLKKHIRLPSGLKAYCLRHPEATSDMVQKVQSLSRKEIEKAFQSIPKNMMSKAKQKRLKKLLLYRQSRINEIMQSVLQQLEKKRRATM